MPVVSIAIPFKDPGKHFVPALQSVFSQTVSDWELLLIDDGSQDGSAELAAELTDQRVRYFRDGETRKLNIRLNEATKLAQGEFLFRMDADDVMHPQRLERQLEVLRKSTSKTVVGTAAYSIDANSKVVGWRPRCGKQLHGFSARHSFIHPTVAARTEWFQKNPYSKNFIYHRSQDAELWCRTSGSSEFCWIDEPLLFYREQGMFNLPNYLATQMGILHLISAQAANRRSALKRSAQTLIETAKMCITIQLAQFGREDLIIRNRYRSLEPSRNREAQAVLDAVLRATISVGNNKFATAGTRSK